MNPIVIGGVLEAIGSIADDLFTSDKERLDAEIELKRIGIEAAKIEAGLVTAQIEVNKTEAQHSSIFVAGWRPAIGWTGAAAMAYQFLLYPMLVWAWSLMQANDWVPVSQPPPPVLEAEALWVLMSGMLGVAGARTFEKIKGVAK